MNTESCKWVPVEPTLKMVKEAGRAYDRAGNKPTEGTFLDAIEQAVVAAIAAAPEPVCKWTCDGGDIRKIEVVYDE